MPDTRQAPRTTGDYTPPGRPPAPPPALTRGGSAPRVRTRLVWRILLAAGASVILILAAVLGLVSVFASHAADEALREGLADAGRHVSAVVDRHTSALMRGATVFAQDPNFRSFLLGADTRLPADQTDQAQVTAQQIEASWVQLVDADGIRLARSDDPEAAATPQSLRETALVGGALAKRAMSGAGVAGDTAIFLGVAVPVIAGDPGDPRAPIAGVLLAARALDAAVARDMRRQAESQVLIYLRDAAGRARSVASTLPATAERAVLDSAVLQALGGALTLRVGDTTYVAQDTPLRAATGAVVGGVLTLRSRDRELAPFIVLQRRIALAGVGGLLLALGVAFGVARQISAPIRALRDAALRVAAGDFTGGGVAIDSTGEVAELADAVRAVLDQVQERHELAGLVEQARAAAPSRDEPRPPVDTLPVGTQLARRYTIEGVLGVGGNGVVYRATDRELGESVAVKTLRPEALAGGPEALERLKDEIRLARRISHAGVVRIHDLGEDGGTYFITMEHVAGLPLAEILRRLGRLRPAQVVAVGRQLCGALAAAHAQGVIHRDVKPQNIVVQPDGALKVLDFGVARLAERASGLTASGLLVGTPAYMAPEQLLDEPVDLRADVYAAGVVLYEAATGRPPFQASTPAALIGRVLSETPPAPFALDPALPPALSDAIMRALAHDRDQRPASAVALHDLLVRAAGA